MGIGGHSIRGLPAMSTANAISDPAQHRPSVFISGSISIRALPIPVTDRLDVILDRKLPVLIGDALGVDAAAQHHLAMWVRGTSPYSVPVQHPGTVQPTGRSGASRPTALPALVPGTALKTGKCPS